MPKKVKRYYSKLPAGLYRALKDVEIYIGTRRVYVPEGQVVNLGQGEANKNFEALEMPAGPPINTVNKKAASILNALSDFNVGNNSHWTDQGLPVMSIVKAKTGDMEITRRDVEEAYPGFCKTLLEKKDALENDPEDTGAFGQGSMDRNRNHMEI